MSEERLRAFEKEVLAEIGAPPGYTLWPPEGAKIVYDMPVRSDKWAAAERLASYVVHHDKFEPGDGFVAIGRSHWRSMLADAKRVLGEE